MRQPRKSAPWLGALLACGLGSSLLMARVDAEPDASTPAPGPVDAGAQAPVSNAPATVESEPEPESTTATITFATTPAATATVTWGRKRLGIIKPGKPLVLVRPRDSGPLDVVVRAVGYLPVQTRAHTFSDSRVLVKLTPPEQSSELWGYRAPVDAGLMEGGVLVDGSVVFDGGVPSEAGAVPPPNADAPLFPMAPVSPAQTPLLAP